MTADQLDRLIRLWERRFFASWSAMMESVRNELTLKELETLLASGKTNDAIELVTARVGQWFQANWLPALMESAGAAGAWLERELGIPIVFEGTNYSAVRALQAHRIRLVTAFTEQQTASTLQAIQRAMTTGANPRDVARAFRDSINLTSGQEAAVANYRRLLQNQKFGEAMTRELRDKRFDATLEGARAKKLPLTDGQIERMVTRYRERMFRYRSETIARTEALRAVHTGQHEMYTQAIQEGSLRADQLEREWNTASDERVRHSHRFMHRQKRGPLEAFVSGLGNLLLYPGDPSAPVEDVADCRCAVGTRIVQIVVA